MKEMYEFMRKNPKLTKTCSYYTAYNARTLLWGQFKVLKYTIQLYNGITSKDNQGTFLNISLTLSGNFYTGKYH